MLGATLAAEYRLSAEQAAQFDAFHRLLTIANERVNLTAVLGDGDALDRHYRDSLSALPYLAEGASLVDIGTGAGFPGIPLAIARPDLHITFLDALSKRVAFVNDCLQALGIQGQAVHARAEDFAKIHREQYDIAGSRAVASLPVLCEWALPLVAVGGFCLFWKGPAVDAEWEDACRVAPLLGGAVPERLQGLQSGFQHTLVRVNKDGATAARFPRRSGMALKRPL